ncbi:hypothetical protein [Enterobacter hormaechei]|uniref:hypothetical protein n=1 Tax=Enterobacter hormaechei TaxID=158836 RepID=UPI002072FF67|nr:hypothetical protein [Enterobacter hormaechei]
MKFLDDIISSIAGNAKTRINDPFIGTFFCTWIACNWNHLALLFWGEGKVTERINAFYGYLYETPLLKLNYIFMIPFLITLFYLLIFPWGAVAINFIQRWASEKLHGQAVDIELAKINQQKKLNKEKLLSDPDKQFLEQLAQLDIDKRNEIQEHLRQRGARLAAKALEASEKAKEQMLKTQDAENKEKVSALELEKKTNQAELERIRFESSTAKARATLASHRFPSAYFLILKIEESLKNDGIKISLQSLSNIVSVLFGYEDFEELLADKNFNNETLDKIEFIYYDDELAKRLEEILLEEDSENEDLTSDMLFEHFEIIFDDLNFSLVSGDDLAEKCKETFENNRYNVFNTEGLSGAIAESDTVFDEIEDINIEQFEFDNGFYTELSAHASGSHYKEEGVSGRSMSVYIQMKSSVLIGKFGLGSIEEGDVSGTLDDYE